MSSATMPDPPAGRAFIVEQVRAVGLATRRELVILGAGFGLLVLSMAVIALFPAVRVQIDAEMALDLNPEDLGYLTWVVAIFAPLAVWKGETPWGDSQLWCLPVEHPRHALAKVGAGWVWLMGVVAVGSVALGAAALLSGGGLGVETTRLVVVDPIAARAGGAAGTSPMPWTSPWWQWLIPFTSATALYLLASALWIGTPHPWLWLAGLYLGGLVVGGFLELTSIAPLESGADTFLGSVDQLISSGLETLRRFSRDDAGEGAWSWWALPSFGRWAPATAAWLVAGLGAVLFAARRHREG